MNWEISSSHPPSPRNGWCSLAALAARANGREPREKRRQKEFGQEGLRNVVGMETSQSRQDQRFALSPDLAREHFLLKIRSSWKRSKNDRYV